MAVMSGWFRGVVRNDEPTQPVTVYARTTDDFIGDVLDCMARIKQTEEKLAYEHAQLRGFQQRVIDHFAERGLPFGLEALPYNGKPYKFEDAP